MSGPGMSWLRLYTDFVYSRKVCRLPEKMQARLVKLWCLHQSGHLVGASTPDLAYELRLPEREVKETLQALTEAGFLDPDGTPHNWDKRQFASDNTTARTRAHRERSRERSEEPDGERSGERSGNVRGNGQNRTEQNRAEQTARGADDIPYEEIISHLNQRAGSAYRATTKATQAHIRARWNEGYRLEDFQAVVDDRVSRWRHKPDMAGYLRPETLFGPKFEGYLQAARSASRTTVGADDDLPDIADLMAQEAAHG